MNIRIVREGDGFALYIDDKYFGTYDSPVQAAQAVEELTFFENEGGESK